MRRAFFALLLVVWVPAAAAETVLGVLEDQPGKFEGEPHRRVLRAVFKSGPQGWTALPAKSAHVVTRWTVAFDGRVLGTVTMVPDAALDDLSSDAGLEAVLSPGTAPKIGAPSQEFAGWLGEPVLRPLIAVSAPNAADPQHWRRATLEAAAQARLRAAFRNVFPHADNCANAEENVARPWTYGDADIAIEKSYVAAARSWALAQVRLGPNRCDGPPDDEFHEQMFVIAPGGEVMRLGDGLQLIDAGDYDGDGKSELVFMIDRYNESGYEIMSDDFRRRATFLFHHH